MDISREGTCRIKLGLFKLRCTRVGENARRILQNNPASGRVGKVMCDGRSPAVYGASVTVGNSLTPDASGKLVAALAGSGHVLPVERPLRLDDEKRPLLEDLGAGYG